MVSLDKPDGARILEQQQQEEEEQEYTWLVGWDRHTHTTDKVSHYYTYLRVIHPHMGEKISSLNETFP